MVKAEYSGVREGVTYTFPIEVNPILMSADEISPGNASLVRIEYQDFTIDRVQLQSLYPPQPGDTITLLNSAEIFRLASIGGDEPPYQHVTSCRDRVLVHSTRTSRGY